MFVVTLTERGEKRKFSFKLALTSSNYEVKIARFYEFLFTLLRLKKNKKQIFVQVSIPVACLISEIQQFSQCVTPK